MINECVKLIATPFGSGGKVAKLTWELCECCSFTRLKLLRIKNPVAFYSYPPTFFNGSQWITNDSYFRLGTPTNTLVYPFPPPAIANQVWSDYAEAFDIAFGEYNEWYVGPSEPIEGFGDFFVRNVDAMILMAQCCNTGVWMMSKLSIVTFFGGPWTGSDRTIPGYSGATPPS